MFEDRKEGQMVAGAGRGESGQVARKQGKRISDLQGLPGEIRDVSIMIRMWKTSLKDFFRREGEVN